MCIRDREQIVHLYHDSEMIVSTASVLLILAAAYQLPDCLQVLSVGAVSYTQLDVYKRQVPKEVSWVMRP